MKRWFSFHLTCSVLSSALLGVNHQRPTRIHPGKNAYGRQTCHFTVLGFEVEAAAIFQRLFLNLWKIQKFVHWVCSSAFGEVGEVWTDSFQEHQWLSGWRIGKQVLSLKKSCWWVKTALPVTFQQFLLVIVSSSRKCVSHFLFWLHFNLLSTCSLVLRKSCFYRKCEYYTLVLGLWINIVMKTTIMNWLRSKNTTLVSSPFKKCQNGTLFNHRQNTTKHRKCSSWPSSAGKTLRFATSLFTSSANVQFWWCDSSWAALRWDTQARR